MTKMKEWTSCVRRLPGWKIVQSVAGVVTMLGVVSIYLHYDEQKKKEGAKNLEQVKAHIIVFEVQDDNARDYGYALINEIMAIKGLKDAVHEKGLTIDDCKKMNVAKIHFVIHRQSDEKAEDNPWVKKVRERLVKDEKVEKIKVMDIPYYLS